MLYDSTIIISFKVASNFVINCLGVGLRLGCIMSFIGLCVVFIVIGVFAVRSSLDEFIISLFIIITTLVSFIILISFWLKQLRAILATFLLVSELVSVASSWLCSELRYSFLINYLP